MQKTRIEIKADLFIHANGCKAARYKFNNYQNSLSNIIDNDREDKIDSSNLGLIKLVFRLRCP